jgi:hypothetical protein
MVSFIAISSVDIEKVNILKTDTLWDYSSVVSCLYSIYINWEHHNIPNYKLESISDLRSMMMHYEFLYYVH